MNYSLFLFTLFSILVTTISLAQRDAELACQGKPILDDFECECGEINRDFMFLVDASDSLNPAVFYSLMLNQVQEVWCSVMENGNNRAGMILFASTIKVAVPLRNHTKQEWFDQIELVRSDEESCCSCCTPMAEAFELTRQVLEQNPPVNSLVTVTDVFIVTDGDPWQNFEYHQATWPYPRFSPAQYRYEIVPRQAQLLKAVRGPTNIVNLNHIGVPNKNLQPPEEAYFRGVPDPQLRPNWSKNPMRQCIWRGLPGRKRATRSCATIDPALFPIPRSFGNIDGVIDIACRSCIPEPIPTGIPTESPTQYPTTQGPSKAPATPIPSSQPTKDPTRYPTNLPTEHPTAYPTRSPTLYPTNQPSKEPTRKPTNLPTRNPTTYPSASPSLPPTLAPSNHPTQKTPPHLDLFVFIDRSRSMRWRHESCAKASGFEETLARDPNADPVETCWRLFLSFVERLVTRVNNMQDINGNRMLWKDEHPPNAPVDSGLRVWIYGFACTNSQNVPVVERIAEGVSNLQDFQQSIVNAMNLVPDGGTCPSAALQRALGKIQTENPFARPVKSALLLTDGRFYDQIPAKTAMRGFHYFGIQTFALGIAIPEEDNNYGLKPFEIEIQRNQLLFWAEHDESRIKNLGRNGYELLSPLVEEYGTEIDQFVLGDLIPSSEDQHGNPLKPYICQAFTTPPRCDNMKEENFASGKYCKWVNNQCIDRYWCNYSSFRKCRQDNVNCVWWAGEGCRFRGWDEVHRRIGVA